MRDECEHAPPRITRELGSQHVLKAEAARPDATDRETPADASPVGGPTGAEQAHGLPADAVQPFLFSDGAWIEARDGNPTAASIYDRHYSRNPASRGDYRCAGPGEKIVLLTPCARALLVWRRFLSKDPTVARGDVNCAIFRNEGAGSLSSDLLRAAMAIAWRRWPGARLYTYVNPRRVRSANPGYCFLMAGWRHCGVTKTRKLLVLEALP